MVKWLGEAGFDIGDGLGWDPDADAGMERSLEDAPCYVVKNPWLFIAAAEDRLPPELVDVLVLPMRDLDDAAASRVRVQRRALDKLGRSAELEWTAQTAGGVVYPVNTHDQARWLAEGFYRMLEWAVRHDVPTVFTHYPRIAVDENYAMCKAAEMVDAGTYMEWTDDLATEVREAHRRTAFPR